MTKWADRAIEEAKKRKSISEPKHQTTNVSSPIRGANQDQSGYGVTRSVADYTISDETDDEQKLKEPEKPPFPDQKIHVTPKPYFPKMANVPKDLPADDTFAAKDLEKKSYSGSFTKDPIKGKGTAKWEVVPEPPETKTTFWKKRDFGDFGDNNTKKLFSPKSMAEEQIDEVIAGVGAVRSTPVTMQSSPRGKKAVNAPSSAGRLQRAADIRRRKLDQFAQQQKDQQHQERERQQEKRTLAQQKRQHMREEYEVRNHPVYGKVLAKAGKTVTADYDTADDHSAKHKGSLIIKSMVPKKYHVKMPEHMPVGPIKEQLGEDNLGAIAKANPNIRNLNVIMPGQKVNLPGGGSYTVARGDTMSGIASGKYKGSAPTTPKAPEPPKSTTSEPRDSSPSTPTPSPTKDLTPSTNGKDALINRQIGAFRAKVAGNIARVSKELEPKTPAGSAQDRLPTDKTGSAGTKDPLTTQQRVDYEKGVKPYRDLETKARSAPPSTTGVTSDKPTPFDTTPPRPVKSVSTKDFNKPTGPAPKTDNEPDWAMSTKDAKLKQDIGNQYQKTGGYTVTKSVQPSTDGAMDLIKKGAAAVGSAVSGAVSGADSWLDKNVRKPLASKGLIPQSALKQEENQMQTDNKISRFADFISEEEKKKRGRPPKATTDTGEEAAEKRHSLVAQFRDRKPDASGHYSVDVDGSSHRIHTSHAQRFLSAHGAARTADQKDAVERKFKSEIKGKK